jgi:hypothetical protein
VFIRISFSPRTQLVSAVSQLAAEFCRRELGDRDATSRFHMVAHELAENIAKYSTAPEVTLEVDLSKDGAGRALTIRTRNRASPERLADVARRMRELALADNPDALYDRLLEESLAVEGVSGLGLARIRAESGLDLEYSIEGDELTVMVKALLHDA